MALSKTPKTDNKDVFRFLKKSYDEALELLVYARDYFEKNGHREIELLGRNDQLIYTLAISTVTTQLTSVMSWLMMCRAIENGEIKARKISREIFCVPEYNLGVHEKDACFKPLSKASRDILAKSCNLYNRIKRMEDSVREHLLEV